MILPIPYPHVSHILTLCVYLTSCPKTVTIMYS